jgi:hypothetical protein
VRPAPIEDHAMTDSDGDADSADELAAQPEDSGAEGGAS